MKNHSAILVLNFVLILVINFFPTISPAQSTTNHYWTVKVNTSQIVFGKTVYGTEGELKYRYFVPGGMGLGAEFAYERGNERFAVAANVGLRNIKYFSNKVFHIDVYTVPRKAISTLALQANLLGKIYFPINEQLNVDVQLGFGASRNLILERRTFLAYPKTWGWHNLTGLALNFAYSERNTFSLGLRHTYQWNGYHDESHVERYDPERYFAGNTDKNNHILVFSVGIKTKFK